MIIAPVEFPKETGHQYQRQYFPVRYYPPPSPLHTFLLQTLPCPLNFKSFFQLSFDKVWRTIYNTRRFQNHRMKIKHFLCHPRLSHVIAVASLAHDTISTLQYPEKKFHFSSIFLNQTMSVSF